MINVAIDSGEAQTSFAILQEILGVGKHHTSERMGKIMVRVMKRVAENYRAEIIRQTSARYFISKHECRLAFNNAIKFDSDVNNCITLAHFHSDGYRRNLALYKAYNEKHKKGERSAGIRARVLKGGQAKFLPGAWISRRTGKAMRRVGGRVYAIASPAVPQIFKNPDTLAAAKSYANKKFVLRIYHEFEREMKVLAGGRRNNGLALRYGGLAGCKKNDVR